MSPAVSLHLVCGFPSLPCLISGSCHFMAISISCFCFKTSRSEHFRNGGFTGPRPANWANAKSRARSENGIWADFKNWRLCTDRAANNVHGNVMKRVWLVVWNMNFIFPYIGNNNLIWKRGWNQQPAFNSPFSDMVPFARWGHPSAVAGNAAA